MKLIIAIIEKEYVSDVIEGLMKEKIRATRLASTGGFLKSGNTTLLMGVEEEDKDKAVAIIEKNCGHKHVVSEEKGDVEVGGATLFILDMDKYLRI